MEIICYALDIEAMPLKKHFGENVRFEKCDVFAKNLDFLKTVSANDHITNIGICAGANVGEIYLCNKIHGEKTFYPDLLIPNNLEQREITTVDHVVNEDEVKAHPNMLYDQEAAIIFEHAQKCIAPHQISFLKIVSDSGITDFEKIKKSIPQLIENKIPEIEAFISSSQKFFSKIDTKEEIKNLDKYSELLKCSATMKVQLAQLLRYAQICNIDVENFFKDIKISSKKDSLQILKSLKNFLLSEDK